MTQKTAQSVGRGSAMRCPITCSALPRQKIPNHLDFIVEGL